MIMKDIFLIVVDVILIIYTSSRIALGIASESDYAFLFFAVLTGVIKVLAWINNKKQ